MSNFPSELFESLYDDDTPVQLLYIKLESGKTLLFLGAPLEEDELMNIKSLVFAEPVMASELMVEVPDSRITAQ